MANDYPFTNHFLPLSELFNINLSLIVFLTLRIVCALPFHIRWWTINLYVWPLVSVWRARKTTEDCEKKHFKFSWTLLFYAKRSKLSRQMHWSRCPAENNIGYATHNPYQTNSPDEMIISHNLLFLSPFRSLVLLTTWESEDHCCVNVLSVK
jgi:hypothetical protein